jgi:hypothetical protein
MIGSATYEPSKPWTARVQALVLYNEDAEQLIAVIHNFHGMRTALAEHRAR